MSNKCVFIVHLNEYKVNILAFRYDRVSCVKNLNDLSVFPKMINKNIVCFVKNKIKKYQWDIQGKGKSTITDIRRTTRTRQKQHRYNTKN